MSNFIQFPVIYSSNNSDVKFERSCQNRGYPAIHIHCGPLSTIVPFCTISNSNSNSNLLRLTWPNAQEMLD